MLAISPIDQLSTLTWLMEDPIISHHEQENPNFSTMNVCDGTENLITETTSDYSIDRYFHDRSDPLGAGINNSDECSGFHRADHRGNGDGHTKKMVKKLNHNASERDRRRRINKLYSDLRSLLPAEDQSKKLSIPATVTRVLKYIPELRDEVEKLSQKKKSLIRSKISIQKEEEEELSIIYKERLIKKRKTDQISSSAISTTQISDGEIIIQISIPKSENGSLCGALTYLEMDGILVQSASSFKSFDGRFSCILHIQAQGSRMEDAEILKEKILSFF